MKRPTTDHRSLAARLAAALLGLAASCAWGQATEDGGTPAPGAPAPGAPTPAPATPEEGAPAPATAILGEATPFPYVEGSPWYIGINQALTYDDNIFRTSNGSTSDTFSSTSIVGGFNQPIGRQRVFGVGNLSYHHYFDHDTLDNTSYNFAGGLNWETVNNLSGTVRVGFGQNLSAPVSGVIVPTFSGKNTSNTRDVFATARWGGSSSLSIEGSLGYSDIEYSATRSTFLETSQGTAGIALRYHSGAPWGVGIGGHYTQQRTPHAALLADGTFVGNNVDGHYVDLLFDYNPGPTLALNGRLSYTWTTNSGISNADFSGWTGNASLNWLITGKTSFRLYAARDVGYNTTPFSAYTLVFIGNTPILTPANGLYENNQLTGSAGASFLYAATAKISATAGVRYSRAHLLTTTIFGADSQARPDTIDTSTIGYITAGWAIARNWHLAANYSHEKRDISGARTANYTDNLISAAVQYTWR